MLPFLPRDEWHHVRVPLFCLGAALLLLSSTGIISHELFAVPTSEKYVTTVISAASLILLTLARAPLRPIVFLAVLSIPLFFVFSFGGMQPSPLIVLVIVGLFVAAPRRVSSQARLAWMSGVFMLFLLPAIIGSNDPGYYFVWLAVTLGMGWLTYLVARERRGPQLIALAVTLVGLTQGAVAIWEFTSGHQIDLYSSAVATKPTASYFFNYAGFFRPEGTLPDPIALGQVLCICIPIAVAFSAMQTRLFTGFVVMASVGVAALGLTLSLDRASLLGGLAGVLLTLVLLPRRSRWRSTALIVMVLAIVTLAAFGIAPRAISDRIESMFHPTAAHVATQQGDLLRERQWNAAIKTGETNIVTGVGFGNITSWLPRYGASVNSASQAQDVWLQILAEGGVLGLLAIVGIVLAGVRDIISAFARHRVMIAGLAGAILASVVAWTTDWEIRQESVAAMLAVAFGLTAALADTPAGGTSAETAPEVADG